MCKKIILIHLHKIRYKKIKKANNSKNNRMKMKKIK